MKGLLTVLTFSVSLLTPISTTSQQPTSPLAQQKQSRKNLHRSRLWSGLGIAGVAATVHFLKHNHALLNDQLFDKDYLDDLFAQKVNLQQHLAQLTNEAEIDEAKRQGYRDARDTFEDRTAQRDRERCEIQNKLNDISASEKLFEESLTKARQKLWSQGFVWGAPIAALVCFFKAYKNLPDQEHAAAMHVGKAINHGIASVGISILGTGLSAFGCWKTAVCLYHKDTVGLLYGTATAVALKYGLPKVLLLAKKHWQTTQEEWTLSRNHQKAPQKSA